MTDIRRMPASSQQELINDFTNFIEEMHENPDTTLSLSEIISGVGHCSISFLKKLAGPEATLEWLEMQVELTKSEVQNIPTTLQ